MGGGGENEVAVMIWEVTTRGGGGVHGVSRGLPQLLSVRGRFLVRTGPALWPSETELNQSLHFCRRGFKRERER